ncbi:hypothetical protein [Cerasicoccus maritimus]|uniref:hypothetical protein n=1 Tax=Cerasicoccus maritimus TaxID=490089 RepID=UPI0028526BE7|nr:hypothetical protein [Cerasicoccus maritimus]
MSKAPVGKSQPAFFITRLLAVTTLENEWNDGGADAWVMKFVHRAEFPISVNLCGKLK